MADDEQSDFEPPIDLAGLDPEVVEAREWWDANAPAATAQWAPFAEAHLAVCQDVVDAMKRIHREIVDRFDIDLSAETRWVAILESTARCVALADALIDQLRCGYASETAGTARVLHEALELAVALAVGDEGEARRWLRGKRYPSKTARKTRTDYFDRLATEVDLAQTNPISDPEGAGPTLGEVLVSVSEDIGMEVTSAGHAIGVIAGRVYGDLSAGAHNRRPGFADSVAVGLRRFSYGRHPDFATRTNWINIAEALIEQTCLDFAACLSVIVGVEAIRDVTADMARRVHAVRLSHPLD